MKQHYTFLHDGEAALSYQEWLDRIAIELAYVTGAIGSAIWTWSEQSDALEILAQFRLSDDYIAYGNQSATLPIAKERGPIYRACRFRIPIEVEMPFTSVEWEYFSGGYKDSEIKFVYAAPIMHGNQALGTVALYFEELKAMPVADKLAVEVLTGKIALHLFQHAQEQLHVAQLKELKEANALLEASIARLKEMDRLKNEILHTVSHEFRTPLTSIKGFAGLMKQNVDENLTTGQLDFLEQIDVATNRLTQLVEDLLLSAKLEAGTFDLDPCPCDVVLLAQGVVSSLYPQALSKGISLCLDAPDEPVDAWIDGARIEQVLLNLLGNALKFTERSGQVTLMIREEDQHLYVRVEDTGCGVPLDKQAYVFDKFYQVDTLSTGRAKGVGLGLSIARSLVQAHGGTIGLESEVGRGTAVSFKLPLEDGF